MLSTSILSFSNNFVEEDNLCSSNSNLSLNSSVNYLKTKYLGCILCQPKSSIKEKGLSLIQQQILDLYADAQKKYFTNPYLCFKERGFHQVLEICDYGIVIGEKDPTARTTLGINGSSNLRKEEKIVVTKVITPLSNIVLWASLKFHSRLVKQKGKKYIGAAFIPLSCSSAIFKERSFTRLTMKQKFLINLPHPPLFLCVLRKVSSPKIFECHLFACNSLEDVITLSSQMFTIQQDFSKIGSLSLPLPGDMGSYSFSSLPCHNSTSSPALFSPNNYLNEYNINERRCVTNFRSKSPTLSNQITTDSQRLKDSCFSYIDWNNDQCSSDLYKIETPIRSFYNDSPIYSKVNTKKVYRSGHQDKSQKHTKPFIVHEVDKKPISVRFTPSANKLDQIDSGIFTNGNWSNPSFFSDQEARVSKYVEDEHRKNVANSIQSSYSKNCPLCEKSQIKRTSSAKNIKPSHRKADYRSSFKKKRRVGQENESPLYSKVNSRLRNGLKEENTLQISSSFPSSKSYIETNNYNGYIVKVQHDDSSDSSNPKMIISKSMLLSSEDEDLSKSISKINYPINPRVARSTIEDTSLIQLDKGIQTFQDNCEFNTSHHHSTIIRPTQSVSEYRLPYNYCEFYKRSSKNLRRSIKSSFFKRIIHLRPCFKKGFIFKFKSRKRKSNFNSHFNRLHFSKFNHFAPNQSLHQESSSNRQQVFNSSLSQSNSKSQYIGMDLSHDMLKLSIKGTEELPEEKIVDQHAINSKRRTKSSKSNQFNIMPIKPLRSPSNLSHLPNLNSKDNGNKNLSQINLLEELGYLP